MGKLIDLSGLSEFKTKLQAWINTQLAGKKNTQTAVSDPSASGTSLSFISGITQNAQGVITPSKKNIATDTTPTLNSTNLITSDGVYNSAVLRLGNTTTDVKASALALVNDGLYSFVGSGSTYTGDAPTTSNKYGTFIVQKRGTERVILSLYDNIVYICYYRNSAWSNWYPVDATAMSMLGYYAHGSSATYSIPNDRFVVWNNVLYKSTTAIGVGVDFGSTNLTAVSGGGLNDLLGTPYKAIRSYSNATMEKIIADIPYGNIGFVVNTNVAEANRPSGITSTFYLAIIPKLNLSTIMFAIVWSNVDAPHLIYMGDSTTQPSVNSSIYNKAFTNAQIGANSLVPTGLRYNVMIGANIKGYIYSLYQDANSYWYLYLTNPQDGSHPTSGTISGTYYYI